MSSIIRIFLLGLLMLGTVATTVKTVNILHNNQVARNEIAAKQSPPETSPVSQPAQTTGSQTTGSPTTGTTKPSTAISAPSPYSIASVTAHNTTGNCWMIVSGKIYNLTSFLGQHPGGVGAITPYCGKDGTLAFQTRGRTGGSNHSAYAYSLLPSYFVANVSAGIANATNKVTNNGNASVPSSQSKTVSFALAVGRNVQVDNAVSLRVRSSANGTQIGSQGSGATGTIVGGPIVAGGHTWWNTNFNTGTDGWVAGDYLILVITLGSPQATVDQTAQNQTTVQTPAQAQTTPSQSPSSNGYTTADVATHNSQGNCWLVISGKIYNVTSFITSHPGGANAIISRCGTDATAVFTSNANGGHSHSAYAQSLLPTYYVSNLSTTQTTPSNTSYTISVSSSNGTVTSNPGGISCGSTCSASFAQGTSVTLSAIPTSGYTFSGWSGACSGIGSCTVTMNTSQSVSTNYTQTQTGGGATTYTAAHVATHNSQGNCWLIISAKVYNVTGFISSHPGGSNAIISRCGTDATTVFNSGGGGGHNHSASARALLPTYYVGDVGTGTTPPVTPPPVTPPPGNPPTGGGGPVTYTVNVTSAGNYDNTNLTLNVGDSIRFVYTPPIGNEVKTAFSPAGISSLTLDDENTQRTRTFPTAGTWTFKAQDHSGNTGTVVVQ